MQKEWIFKIAHKMLSYQTRSFSWLDFQTLWTLSLNIYDTYFYKLKLKSRTVYLQLSRKCVLIVWYKTSIVQKPEYWHVQYITHPIK